jgi:hypothetical protein
LIYLKNAERPRITVTSPPGSLQGTPRIFRSFFARTTAIAVCMTGLGFAQTAALASNQQELSENQSTLEASKSAANPLSDVWLMQWQQDDYWIGMPPGAGDGIQSRLQFQPLISMKLTDDWNLVMRPILPVFSTSPYRQIDGSLGRVTGYGDTAFAMALTPSRELVGNWLLAAGPTFIFPTATESLLGQNKWQFGPTAAVGYVGQRFLTYVFPQQWFSIAGNGAKTSQMDAKYAFTYFLPHGWSIGTSPDVLVNWQAKSGQRVAFPVGFQIGKLRKFGPLPVMWNVQVEYYPVHPDPYGPKWDLQLLLTPILPALVKRL